MKLISFTVASIFLVTINVAHAQRCDQYYTTKSGDTLSSIAFQFYGDRQKWRLIKDANSTGRSINENNMPIDFRLYIPCENGEAPAQNIAAGDEGEVSLLESLLGDGIIKKPKSAESGSESAINQSDSDAQEPLAEMAAGDNTPAQDLAQENPGQPGADRDSTEALQNMPAESSQAVSSESSVLLEELLGEDIISKKSLDDEELTKALFDILLQSPAEDVTETSNEQDSTDGGSIAADGENEIQIIKEPVTDQETQAISDQESADETEQQTAQTDSDIIEQQADSN